MLEGKGLITGLPEKSLNVFHHFLKRPIIFPSKIRCPISLRCYFCYDYYYKTPQMELVVKNCQCRRPKRHSFSPWVGRIPWRRKWQPTPVFLPGKSHGQKSLAGYSPWGCKRVGWNLVTKQQQRFFKKNL